MIHKERLSNDSVDFTVNSMVTKISWYDHRYVIWDDINKKL